jgi:hypothetical protein
MNTRLLITGAIVLVSASVAYATVITLTKEEPVEKVTEPNQTQPYAQTEPLNSQGGTTLTKPSLKTPVVSDPVILRVTDLTRDKEKFLGKRVQVHGKISVNISHGERSCPPDDAECDTVMGIQLELWEQEILPDLENRVLLFSNNQPYPCPRTASYTCPPFTSGQITTVEGVWSKDQVATSWRGGSGGGAPTPTAWGDRYYLSIE